MAEPRWVQWTIFTLRHHTDRAYPRISVWHKLNESALTTCCGLQPPWHDMSMLVFFDGEVAPGAELTNCGICAKSRTHLKGSSPQ